MNRHFTISLIFFINYFTSFSQNVFEGLMVTKIIEEHTYNKKIKGVDSLITKVDTSFQYTYLKNGNYLGSTDTIKKKDYIIFLEKECTIYLIHKRRTRYYFDLNEEFNFKYVEKVDTCTDKLTVLNEECVCLKIKTVNSTITKFYSPTKLFGSFTTGTCNKNNVALGIDNIPMYEVIEYDHKKMKKTSMVIQLIPLELDDKLFILPKKKRLEKLFNFGGKI